MSFHHCGAPGVLDALYRCNDRWSFSVHVELRYNERFHQASQRSILTQPLIDAILDAVGDPTGPHGLHDVVYAQDTIQRNVITIVSVLLLWNLWNLLKLLKLLIFSEEMMMRMIRG